MENSIEEMILPFKLQQLLDVIIEKRKLNIEDALQYLYSSDLYKQMLLESSYLWQLSTLNLYELLKKEKRDKKHKENNTSAIHLFIVFCLENYKVHKGMDIDNVLFLFKKYNVIEYLIEVFEVLHTQGKEYIMDEIDNYISNRNFY